MHVAFNAYGNYDSRYGHGLRKIAQILSPSWRGYRIARANIIHNLFAFAKKFPFFVPLSLEFVSRLMFTHCTDLMKFIFLSTLPDNWKLNLPSSYRQVD